MQDEMDGNKGESERGKGTHRPSRPELTPLVLRECEIEGVVGNPLAASFCTDRELDFSDLEREFF